jgi:catechol 2,3-dioxygenase-like lactoylglutathione lyase family enzyme
MSLRLNTVTTVLPVDDPQRARRFYTEKLGLPHRGMTDDGSELFGTNGGPMLQLMPVSDGRHSDHTALSFEVADIERTVRDMEASGVQFQDYDLPNLRTKDHICTDELGEVRLVYGSDRAQHPVRPRERGFGCNR